MAKIETAKSTTVTSAPAPKKEAKVEEEDDDDDVDLFGSDEEEVFDSFLINH